MIVSTAGQAGKDPAVADFGSQIIKPDELSSLPFALGLDFGRLK
jgi:hypothetical protein